MSHLPTTTWVNIEIYLLYFIYINSRRGYRRIRFQSDAIEKDEKRFPRTRSSRARGRDLLHDSHTATHHRVRGGQFPWGGAYIYIYIYIYTLARTPRFLLFVGGAKPSIIVAPGQTMCNWQDECDDDDEDDDDDRAHSTIPQVAKYQLHSDRSINRAVSVYTYTFSIGRGNWSNLVGRNEPKRVRCRRTLYTSHIYECVCVYNDTWLIIRTRLWRLKNILESH